MIRIFGLLVLASTLCLASTASAQEATEAVRPAVSTIQNGSVAQPGVANVQSGAAAAQAGVVSSQPTFHSAPQPVAGRPFRLFRRGNQYRSRYASKEDRINHMKYELQTQRFPKFYGGFHANHFNNIGVPSGGIGFRGNGIYWAPWQ